MGGALDLLDPLGASDPPDEPLPFDHSGTYPTSSETSTAPVIARSVPAPPGAAVFFGRRSTNPPINSKKPRTTAPMTMNTTGAVPGSLTARDNLLPISDRSGVAVGAAFCPGARAGST